MESALVSYGNLRSFQPSEHQQLLNYNAYPSSDQLKAALTSSPTLLVEAFQSFKRCRQFGQSSYVFFILKSARQFGKFHPQASSSFFRDCHDGKVKFSCAPIRPDLIAQIAFTSLFLD